MLVHFQWYINDDQVLNIVFFSQDKEKESRITDNLDSLLELLACVNKIQY